MSSPIAAQQLQPFQDVCNGSAKTSSVCQTPGNSNPITGKGSVVMDAVQIIVLATGVAAVVMVIVGGFKYVVSQGDPNAVNSAKNTILFALLGLVIAGSAQLIISFVLNRV
ncbi:MAG TPA: hypothetical protein VLF90_01725 [Patescibacteria group bacterium]|nr:hypothetical protein [Patescibacteria group bacterium]